MGAPAAFTCDKAQPGDVYFDGLYPAQLPSYEASETLVAAVHVNTQGGAPFVLPTFELPSGAVTTVENLMAEELPDGVAVV